MALNSPAETRHACPDSLIWFQKHNNRPRDRELSSKRRLLPVAVIASVLSFAAAQTDPRRRSSQVPESNLQSSTSSQRSPSGCRRGRAGNVVLDHAQAGELRITTSLEPDRLIMISGRDSSRHLRLLRLSKSQLYYLKHFGNRVRAISGPGQPLGDGGAPGGGSDGEDGSEVDGDGRQVARGSA
ncbi:hypothetical protein CDD83_8229 [Cordyceps sp. RAO-2017]|nr:hypothetical protein CDD83_8229 [Cordyceps sp. RAO-2017]